MQNLEIKHLDQASISSTQLTIDALARIAPSCITEVKDSKTGSIKHVVDFHVLRQLLSDQAVEDAPEAYEFTWVGKQEARREAAKSISKTLRPVPEDSVDWDNTQNIYIEGDNLEALKLLQKSYLGKVKMIYIDPPYNTGNDFVYHDDFKQSQSEYDEAAGNINEEGNRLVSRSNSSSLDDAYKKNTDSNGRFHSDWCSMIYSRLMIARSLLTEDGVIFISIDDNEVENLRKICDEVFGEGNFVANIVWEKADSPRMDANLFSVRHDHILLFAKHITEEIILKSVSNEIPAHYDKIDENGKRYYLKPLRSMGAADSREDRPKLFFPITSPTGEQVYPKKSDGSDGRWRWSKDKVKTDADKLVFIQGKNGTTVQYKIYAEELKQTPFETIWYNSEVGSNRTAVKQLKDIFNQKKPFSSPKPMELIKKMLKVTNTSNSLILDFFSGSATTAHAVMQLNAEDGGDRRFIMVQLPEETAEDSEAYKAGYKNICEIGKERIRRAGAKIKEESSALSKASSLDTGFRVFRIDSGNMKDVEQSPSDVDQTKLDFFLDNVKDDRTELDLLFGCMLNWGVQLSLPMSMETVDGCNIYTVNEGDLVACLTKDKPVTENIVRAIAEKSPLRVLFRDGSFASDADKINIFELFKQLMDWNDDEIIKNVRVL